MLNQRPQPVRGTAADFKPSDVAPLQIRMRLAFAHKMWDQNPFCWPFNKNRFISKKEVAVRCFQIPLYKASYFVGAIEYLR